MGAYATVNSPEYRQYMEVVSERLVLRPFAESDVEHVHVYASDPAVCFFTDWGPNSLEDTEAFVAQAVASGPPLNVAITLAKEAAGTPAAKVVTYHRPRQYRATIYSGGETPAFRPTAADLARLVTSGPRFLYLWWP